ADPIGGHRVRRGVRGARRRRRPVHPSDRRRRQHRWRRQDHDLADYRLTSMWGGTYMRGLMLAIALLGAAAWNAAMAAPMQLFVGEIKVLELDPIERVAVGNSALLSTSLQKNGQLLLLAEQPGNTHIRIWFEDGREAQYQVNIHAQDLVNTARALGEIVESMKGLKVEVVGEQVLLRGELYPEYAPLIERVLKKFPDVVNLTNAADKIVGEMLTGVPGLSVSIVGEHVVLRGEYESRHQPVIDAVLKKFPDVVNL